MICWINIQTSLSKVIIATRYNHSFGIWYVLIKIFFFSTKASSARTLRRPIGEAEVILFWIIFSVQWYCTGSMGGAVVRTFASHHWLWPEFKALSFNAILRFSPLLKTWHFQIRIPARMVEFVNKLPLHYFIDFIFSVK